MNLRSRFAPGYEVWGRFGIYGPLVALGVGPSGARLRHEAMAAVRLQPGASVLDVGTGTGRTLPYLAAAAALDEMIRVVRPGGRLVVADVHFVNWPTPAAVNRAVTAALRPFNTWYTDRDFPTLLAERGLRVVSIPTHEAALSLTRAER